ncbi:MAG: hypothetical protein KGL39_55150, partial [Patescibacteria group bacterium]|nr:hypothetical protein [Patescibacteria group bacterium]
MYRVEMDFAVGDLATSPDRITEIGACSSRDEFFAKVGRGDEAVFLPMSAVDETDIAKKAHTNAVVRGVTSLLGIRNVTVEQLEAAGLRVDRIKGVKYDSGSKGGRGEQQSATTDAATLKDEAAKRTELRKWLEEMNDGDIGGAQGQLIDLTRFKGKDGKEQSRNSVDQLSGRWLDTTHGKAAKLYAEWEKAHPKQQAAMPV